MRDRLLLASCACSMLMSILAICVAFYRSPNLGFDYQGVIVATLTILVTVLVGYQVMSVLSFDKTMNTKFDKFKEEYKKELKLETVKANIDLKTNIRFAFFKYGDQEVIFHLSEKIPDLIGELEEKDQVIFFVAEIERLKKYIQENLKDINKKYLIRMKEAYLRYGYVPCVFDFLKYLDSVCA